MKKMVYLLLISVTCSSCLVTHGDYLRTEYSPLNVTDCNPTPGNVYLFFDDEEIDFEYTKLGHVEAIGDRFSDNNEVLESLKYKAWQNCANGVIQIRKGTRYRREGMGLTTDETDIEYNANTFHGLAVQIDVDSTFLAKYGNITQATFITRIEKRQEQSRQRTENQLAMSALLGVGALVIAILAASGSI